MGLGTGQSEARNKARGGSAYAASTALFTASGKAIGAKRLFRIEIHPRRIHRRSEAEPCFSAAAIAKRDVNFPLFE